MHKKSVHNKYYHKTTRNAIKELRGTTDKKAANEMLPKVSSMLDRLAKENALKLLFQNKYNSVSSQIKRELYRGTKGLWRPGYFWDGNIWTGDHWDGSGRTHVQYDLDSDNNGTQDHLETIDFNDIDGDGTPNHQDNDSDNDGTPDGWDMAIFDQRGNQDFDLDFLSDNVDIDKDGDKLLDWWERYYGSDRLDTG